MQTHGNFEEIIVYLILWLLFVVLVEGLVEIILKAGPLEQMRAWIARINGFFADLISCGYCTSVWVAFSIAWILPSPINLAADFGISNAILIFIDDYLWWFVNGLILHRLSNIFHSRVASMPDIELIGDDDAEAK